MHFTLIEHIRKFVSLSESEVQVLNHFVKSKSFKKKEFLLSGGQVCRSMYFVEKGCVRMFFINEKSAEQITQFAIDGWWIADYTSFNDNEASEYFIQTIEPSVMKSIDIAVLDDLLKELPQLERYFRIIWLKNMAASQLKSKQLFEMSKEEFYYHFSTSYPEFMQRVPQYMVASYLGLTPEYVSELRKKKS